MRSGIMATTGCATRRPHVVRCDSMITWKGLLSLLSRHWFLQNCKSGVSSSRDLRLRQAFPFNPQGYRSHSGHLS